MWRRSLMLVTAPLLAFVWMQALPIVPIAAQAGAPFCQPGQAPTFVYGIAELQRRLGATMGIVRSSASTSTRRAGTPCNAPRPAWRTTGRR